MNRNLNEKAKLIASAIHWHKIWNQENGPTTQAEEMNARGKVLAAINELRINTLQDCDTYSHPRHPHRATADCTDPRPVVDAQQHTHTPEDTTWVCCSCGGWSCSQANITHKLSAVREACARQHAEHVREVKKVKPRTERFCVCGHTYTQHINREHCYTVCMFEDCRRENKTRCAKYGFTDAEHVKQATPTLADKLLGMELGTCLGCGSDEEMQRHRGFHKRHLTCINWSAAPRPVVNEEAEKGQLGIGGTGPLTNENMFMQEGPQIAHLRELLRWTLDQIDVCDRLDLEQPEQYREACLQAVVRTEAARAAKEGK